MANTITPYLCARDAAKAIDWYKEAFGATETMRIAEPGGKIGHAELNIGGARFMLADEYPEIDVVSPQHLNGTSVSMHVVVPNVDEFVDNAVKHGAVVKSPVKDQFYGMRGGTVHDPFGHRWFFATVIEELSTEEIMKRARGQA